MSDEFLEYYEPDFTVADELCKRGGAHAFIEEYANEDIQILRCRRCGYRSVGYLNPKFIFLLEEEK